MFRKPLSYPHLSLLLFNKLLKPNSCPAKSCLTAFFAQHVFSKRNPLFPFSVEGYGSWLKRCSFNLSIGYGGISGPRGISFRNPFPQIASALFLLINPQTKPRCSKILFNNLPYSLCSLSKGSSYLYILFGLWVLTFFLIHAEFHEYTLSIFPIGYRRKERTKGNFVLGAPPPISPTLFPLTNPQTEPSSNLRAQQVFGKRILSFRPLRVSGFRLE